MRASTYVRPAALESRLVHFELGTETHGREKKKKKKKESKKKESAEIWTKLRTAIYVSRDIFHPLESRKVGILSQLFAFVPRFRCKSVLCAIKRIEGGREGTIKSRGGKKTGEKRVGARDRTNFFLSPPSLSFFSLFREPSFPSKYNVLVFRWSPIRATAGRAMQQERNIANRIKRVNHKP